MLATLPIEVISMVVDHLRDQCKAFHVVSEPVRPPWPPSAREASSFAPPFLDAYRKPGRYELLNLSQTCRKLRQVILPSLWHSVMLRELEHVDFYDHFLTSVPRAKDTYGVHVHSFGFVWYAFNSYDPFTSADDTQDFTWGTFDANTAPLPSHKLRPGDAERLTSAVVRIISLMPNLLDFAYSAGTLPLPEQVSVVLAGSCPRINAVKIWEDNISTEKDNQRLSTKVQCLDMTTFGGHLKGNPLSKDVGSMLADSESAPFGFKVQHSISHKQEDSTQSDYTFKMLTWIVTQVSIGLLKGRLRKVLLPCWRAILTDRHLVALWLCVDIEIPHRSYGWLPKEVILSRGWCVAIQLLRKALLRMLHADGELFKRSDWRAHARTLIAEGFPLDSFASQGVPSELDLRVFYEQDRFLYSNCFAAAEALPAIFTMLEQDEKMRNIVASMLMRRGPP